MIAPPARSNLTVLKQIVNLIPRSIGNPAAREAGAGLKARVFTPFSHLATMLFAQFTHAIGPNAALPVMAQSRGSAFREPLRKVIGPSPA